MLVISILFKISLLNKRTGSKNPSHAPKYNLLFFAYIGKIFEIFDRIKNNNLYRVYPHNYFCDTILKNRCVTNNKDILFYYDSDHLSLDGSKFVVDDIVKIIKEIR